MVTRKPVTPAINTAPNNDQATSIPPYPTTPTDGAAKPARQDTGSVYSPDLNTSPAFDLIDMHDARRKRSNEDDDVQSRDSWEDSDDEDAYQEGKKDRNESTLRPQPLNVRSSQEFTRDTDNVSNAKRDSLPAALKPGPTPSAAGTQANPFHTQYTEEATTNPWAAAKNHTPQYAPFRPQQQQQQSPPHQQQLQPEEPTLKNRASMWWAQDEPSAAMASPSSPSHAPPPPPNNAPPLPPVELPTQKTPVDELSRMSLASWETAERITVPQQGQPPLSPVVPQQTGGSGNSNPWKQEASHPPNQLPSAVPSIPSQTHPPYPSSSPQATVPQYSPPPGPPQRQSSILDQQYPPPPGPPPSHSSSAPPQPLRPDPISTHQANIHHRSDDVPETPQTKIRRQRSEHYSIKHMRWHDNGRLRTSSILTQNANGPCPLLALVNALVLSTPDQESTALMSTLGTRETISLGLLLDAVFDELTSGRRNSAAELPDVSELYAFLLALHTGMNVNPRFIPPSPLSDAPPSPGLSGVHPAQRPVSQAGTFEQTQELRLYATFGIPLIHGWLPAPHEPAYSAFNRSAQTFDAAQTLPFAEPELEHKMNSEGLNGQEQQLLQDIQTIKGFMNSWPTQLTDHGRDVVSNILKPGEVAILFRNDHFSTIYKEPSGGALMTLVTDAGYASHEEIVWESLVDVNGAASEMFSGDFRSVSHREDAGFAADSSSQTPDSRSRYHVRTISNQNQTPYSPEGPAPPLPGPRPSTSSRQQQLDNLSTPQPTSEHQRTTSEQEDHDLALALQLQEEEEASQREAEQRARRNEQLSQQFLERETADGPAPPIPPRRARRESANRTNPASIPVSTRPSRTERNRADGEEDLPSYEQAASDRPYREGVDNVSASGGHQGSTPNAYDALRRQQSAYAANSSTSTLGNLPPQQRRRSDVNRIRRRSSQAVQGVPPGSYHAGGGGANAPAPPYQQSATGAAPGVRDAEERCVVM